MGRWVAVSTTIEGNRKSRTFGALMKWSADEVLCGLVRFLFAVREESPDGDVHEWTAEQVAGAMSRPLEEGPEILAALRRAGYLREDGERLVVSGWWKWNGRWCRDAQRKRTSRGLPGTDPGASIASTMSEDVRGHSPKSAEKPGLSEDVRPSRARAEQEPEPEQEPTPTHTLSGGLFPDSPPEPDVTGPGPIAVGEFAGSWGDAFERVLWPSLPREVRVAKPKARAAWMKVAPKSHAALLAVMAGLERWKASEKWSRGVYTNASTWINQRRFDDDPPPARGGTALLERWADDRSRGGSGATS